MFTRCTRADHQPTLHGAKFQHSPHQAAPYMPPSPTPAQVVAVLSAALSEEVAGQLTRRKSRPSISFARNKAPAAATAAPASAAASQPSAASSPLLRSSTPAVVAAPLANIASGALLSDRTSVPDVEASTPRSNSSSGRRSIEAKPRASGPRAAATASSSNSPKPAGPEKGGPEAMPAAQSCGCVIC